MGIKDVIDNIPQANSTLLKYIIEYLQKIEEHSTVNKMTVSNLAIVFGPNLIRPKVETVQGALEMPLLQGIVQILIERRIEFGVELQKKEQPTLRNHLYFMLVRLQNHHLQKTYVNQHLLE